MHLDLQAVCCSGSHPRCRRFGQQLRAVASGRLRTRIGRARKGARLRRFWSAYKWRRPSCCSSLGIAREKPHERPRRRHGVRDARGRGRHSGAPDHDAKRSQGLQLLRGRARAGAQHARRSRGRVRAGAAAQPRVDDGGFGSKVTRRSRAKTWSSSSTSSPTGISRRCRSRCAQDATFDIARPRRSRRGR